MKPALKARLLAALELILLASLVLAVLLPYDPAQRPVPSRDSGVFSYIGWRITQGELPYRDIWDHKAPVIFYLDALGLLLTPDSSWGIWLVEFAALWLAAALGYFLLKRLFDDLTAAVLSLLWLFTSFYLLAGGNLTTEYALPMQFAALWLFHRADNSPRYTWYGFALGAVTALLFFTRQNAIAIPAAIGVYLLASRLLRQNPRQLWDEAKPILAGGLLVTVFIVGFFALQGAFQDFWQQVFLYNFIYVDERENVQRFAALFSAMNHLSNLGLAQMAVLGWGAGLALLIFKRERIPTSHRSVLWVAVLALPVELYLASLGGRPRMPYFLNLLPVFAISGGILLHLAFGALLRELPRLVTAALTVVIFSGLWLTFYNDYNNISAGLVDFAPQELVTYIQQNTAPDDTVLMWGAETAYNFAARRRSPVRFVYQYPLYRSDYANKENVTEFLTDLEQNPPRLIITIPGDSLSDIRFGFSDHQIGGQMQRVKSRYSEPIMFGNWLIYTRIDP
jgi:4-amino-4-deoxy-L-arabinose transferase-like glycosyltransferase